MALKLAEGTTLSKRIETIRARMNELLAEFNNPEARKTPGEIQAAQRELVTLHDSLNANQQQLLNLAHMWVTEGIYGQGFYHGDLHAGNIMVSDEKMTLIDFGNATSLSREQQANIMLMMAAASVSSAKMFLEGFEPLLSPAGKAALKEKEQQVREEVKRILSMGTVNDTGERIAVVLKTLQNLDIELPAPIFNFSQCQIRLQNAIDDTNALLDELAAAIPNIGFSEDEGDDTEARLMRSMNPIEYLRYQIGNLGVGPAEVDFQILMESITDHTHVCIRTLDSMLDSMLESRGEDVELTEHDARLRRGLMNMIEANPDLKGAFELLIGDGSRKLIPAEVNTFKFAFAEELKLSLRGVMRQARENNRVQEHEGFVDVMSRVIQQNLSASRKMMGTMNSVKVWWRA